jgi:7-carboxy-7-deazaguanine synthase (Cx14CxxC type)
MSYTVKEIFYSLQGEGANVGRASVFCRFTGCNLWSGHEADRGRAICRFCDTDFVGTNGIGGGTFGTADDLAARIASYWPSPSPGSRPLVICTGGEPLLQLDTALVDAFHARGFEVAVETNGTRPVIPGIDWVTVSPKAGAPLVVERGDELKLVFPQQDLDPAAFNHLPFDHFFLQPMHGPDVDAHRAQAVEYCLRHPRWRLSLQVHRYLGIR